MTTIHMFAQDKTTAGDVTLQMTDGTTKRGYCRTDMVNNVKFFEISAEPKSERTRYDGDQIERIVFDEGAVYVKHDIIATIKGKNPKQRWLRLDYQGRGIALYSGLTEGTEMAASNRSRTVIQRNFYIAMDTDPAIFVTLDAISGGIANQAWFNRVQLTYFFNKRYPHADFAKRIKKKEFDVKDTPIDVVKAWEEAYATKE